MVQNCLDPDDLEGRVQGASEPLDVVAIACHNEIAARDRSNGDACIDHVGGPCAAARVTGGSGSCLVEPLDAAALEETRKLGLGTATPYLAEYTSGHGGSQSSFKRPPVK
jgi:hypothetical protein